MCWCLTKAAFKLIMAILRLADGGSDIGVGVSTMEGTKLYQTLEKTEQISWLLENNMMSNILCGIGTFGGLVGIYEFYWGFLACCNPCGGKMDDDDENNKWIAKVNILAFVVEDLPSLAINVIILAFANGGSGTDDSDSVITRRLDANEDEAGGPGIEDEAGGAGIPSGPLISMGLSVATGLLYIVKYTRAKKNLKRKNGGNVSQL